MCVYVCVWVCVCLFVVFCHHAHVDPKICDRPLEKVVQVSKIKFKI